MGDVQMWIQDQYDKTTVVGCSVRFYDSEQAMEFNKALVRLLKKHAFTPPATAAEREG